MAAIVGVPQVSLRKVELGGNSVTTVAGAVPKVVNGELVAVPPEITSDDPIADPPGSFQVVVRINCVSEPAVLAATLMLWPVYG